MRRKNNKVTPKTNHLHHPNPKIAKTGPKQRLLSEADTLINGVNTITQKPEKHEEHHDEEEKANIDEEAKKAVGLGALLFAGPKKTKISDSGAENKGDNKQMMEVFLSAFRQATIKSFLHLKLKKI